MKQYYDDFSKTQYEDITLKFDSVKSVEARYIKQTEPMDRGNDLIEALIPIKSFEDSLETFEFRPVKSPSRLYSLN